MKRYKVFIDESGDHNLNISFWDESYNIFVLVAVIIDTTKYSSYDNMLKDIKKELRWDDTLILHTVEITRPNKSRNEKNLLFNDSEFRKKFYTKINTLIDSMDMTIIACIIDKSKLVKQYGSLAEDPYLLSFENLLNRILRATWGWVCEIYPERRSHVEDIKLEAVLLRLKTMGTEFYNGSELQNRIANFSFNSKEENESWAQIVDMIATPIGRNYLNKNPKIWNEISYNIIRSKMPSRGKTIFP